MIFSFAVDGPLEAVEQDSLSAGSTHDYGEFNLPQSSVVLASVCPHRAIVNLLQPASTQCDVGPVCVRIELLSTYFNLPQPSVVLVQCVSP